ncbi:MAG: TonB family protein [Gammaproteobacteria bacterium]|nr:TonB family protein [Gammaproteobacteria bacterium]
MSALSHFDWRLLTCVGISLATHGLVVGSITLDSDIAPARVVSSIQIRLSGVVSNELPAPLTDLPEQSGGRTSPPLPVAEEPVAEVLLEPRLIESTHLLVPSHVRPSLREPKISVDPAAVRAFVDGRVSISPTAGEETNVAEAYRRHWHSRVQRIGQLNYPAAAARHKLSGQLTLHVALNGDGSLAELKVLQSSGFETLDLAAMDIVHQSAPFDPLPPTLPRTNGQFRFASTWEFQR